MFTDKGRVYEKRVYELPPGKRDAKGKAIVNLLELQAGEKVLTMLPVKSFDPGWFVCFATRAGTVKKTELDAFANIRSTGIKAIGLELEEGENDTLVSVVLTNGEMDVLLCTRNGYSVRFREDRVRPRGRDARGVRGIALRNGDALVGMATFPKDSPMTLLAVCERGYGKRTALTEYSVKNRGVMGVITIRTSDRNGKVVAVRVVSDEDHLILITDRGKLIRVPVKGVPTVGRATQGVRIMRVEEGELVSSVERLADPEDTPAIEEAAPIALADVPEEADGEEELQEDGGEDDGEPE
jgi:DNA gyrase subunit A